MEYDTTFQQFMDLITPGSAIMGVLKLLEV